MSVFIVKPTREEMVLKLDAVAPGYGESIQTLLDQYPDRWALHVFIPHGGEPEFMTRDEFIRDQLRTLLSDGRPMSKRQLSDVEACLFRFLDLWKPGEWTVTDAVSKRVNDLHEALIAEDA